MKTLLERRLITPWERIHYKFDDWEASLGLSQSDQRMVLEGLKKAGLVKLFWWIQYGDEPMEGQYSEHHYAEETDESFVSVQMLWKFWPSLVALACIRFLFALPGIPGKLLKHVEAHKAAYALFISAGIILYKVTAITHVGVDGVSFRCE